MVFDDRPIYRGIPVTGVVLIVFAGAELCFHFLARHGSTHAKLGMRIGNQTACCDYENQLLGLVYW